MTIDTSPLQARYVASFGEKRAAFESAWRAVVDVGDERALRELQSLAHRLSGSAASYGYADMGHIARSLDEDLTRWVEAAPASRSSESDLATTLEARVHALMDHLARPERHAAAN